MFRSSSGIKRLGWRSWTSIIISFDEKKEECRKYSVSMESTFPVENYETNRNFPDFTSLPFVSIN